MLSGKVNLANDKLLRFKWGKYVVLCSCCELVKATGNVLCMWSNISFSGTEKVAAVTVIVL